ncbi:MAG TPA: YHYH protein [Labilithrix sp.]|nr:YHYH protein [Labilithrix sp.]
MKHLVRIVFGSTLAVATAACGGSVVSEGENSGSDAGGSSSYSSSGDGACSLTANTTAASAPNEDGCAILSRDTSACADARRAAGLDGVWLDISCRVTLSVDSGVVTARTDGSPDYRSFYFNDTDACYEAYSGSQRNPNRIKTHDLAIRIPLSPSGAAQTMHGSAVVGIAINGVAIFGNFAAPQDDIFNEALTFDRCAGHPQQTGMYHYHSEPTSITQDDANLVGIMRDGVPVYGRKDADGTYPTLDEDGGHTGVTPHSPTTPVYHYHVNEQTSTGSRTAGQKQWFITTGRFHYAPATCSGC